MVTIEELLDKIAEQLIIGGANPSDASVTPNVVNENQKTIRNGKIELKPSGNDRLVLYQKDVEANEADLTHTVNDTDLYSKLEGIANQVNDINTVQIYISNDSNDQDNNDFTILISADEVELDDISFIAQTTNNNPLNVSQFIPLQNTRTIVNPDDANRFLDTNIFELLPTGDTRQARIIRFFNELNALLPPESPNFDSDGNQRVDRNEFTDWIGGEQYSQDNSISYAQDNQDGNIDEEDAFFHRLKDESINQEDALANPNSINSSRTIEDIYRTLEPYLIDILEPTTLVEDGRPEYENQSSGYLKFRNLNQGIIIRNTNKEFVSGLDPLNPTWLMHENGDEGTGFTITMWVRFLDKVSSGTLFNYGNPTRGKLSEGLNNTAVDGFGFKLETYIINRDDETGHPEDNFKTFGLYNDNLSSTGGNYISPDSGKPIFENTDSARFVRLVVNGKGTDGKLGHLRSSEAGNEYLKKFTWNSPELPGNFDPNIEQYDELRALAGTHIPEDFNEWYFICASYNPSIYEPDEVDGFNIGTYSGDDGYGKNYDFWMNHVNPNAGINGEIVANSGYGNQCKVEIISRSDLLRARGFKV